MNLFSNIKEALSNDEIQDHGVISANEAYVNDFVIRQIKPKLSECALNILRLSKGLPKLKEDLTDELNTKRERLAIEEEIKKAEKEINWNKEYAQILLTRAVNLYDRSGIDYVSPLLSLQYHVDTFCPGINLNYKQLFK